MKNVPNYLKINNRPENMAVVRYGFELAIEIQDEDFFKGLKDLLKIVHPSPVSKVKKVFVIGDKVLIELK